MTLLRDSYPGVVGFQRGFVMMGMTAPEDAAHTAGLPTITCFTPTTAFIIRSPDLWDAGIENQCEVRDTSSPSARLLRQPSGIQLRSRTSSPA